MSPNETPVRVLIVDDEPELRELYRAVLSPAAPSRGELDDLADSLFGAHVPVSAPRSLHLELAFAAQAEDAVAAVQEAVESGRRFGVVLMDVRMPPGRDGVWAAEQIRRLDARVQMVMVTAFSDIDPAEISARVPPAEQLLYLNKPLHPDELSQTVSALSAKWVQQERLTDAMADLRQSEALHRSLAEVANQQILLLGPGGRVRYANPAFLRLVERTHAEGATLDELLPAPFADALAERAARVFASGEASQGEEGGTFDGTPRWFEVQVVPQWSRGAVESLLVVWLDVTERRLKEDRERFFAYHDPLTALPNRRLLEDRGSVALANARRREARAGLLYLDLDNLKTANDSLGHEAGDALILAAAERLRAELRADDTVARVGGDEFVVLLTGDPGEDDAAAACERIQERLAEAIPFRGTTLETGASIGVALFPDDGDDLEDLIHRADLAMNAAKRAGKGRWQRYTRDLAGSGEGFAGEALHAALRRGELELRFHRQVCAQDGSIVGLEACAWWPEAPACRDEREELLVSTCTEREVGRLVLDRACARLAAWRVQGHPLPRLSVRLGRSDLADPHLVERFRSALSRHGLSRFPGLEVEVQERFAGSRAVQRVLLELRGLGLSIGIQGFNAGRVAITNLRSLPIDRLKVDRSLVESCADEDGGRSLLRALVFIAHGLKVEVVAEGLSTAHGLQDGCDALLIAMDSPLTEDQASALLHELTVDPPRAASAGP